MYRQALARFREWLLVGGGQVRSCVALVMVDWRSGYTRHTVVLVGLEHLLVAVFVGRFLVELFSCIVVLENARLLVSCLVMFAPYSKGVLMVLDEVMMLYSFVGIVVVFKVLGVSGWLRRHFGTSDFRYGSRRTFFGAGGAVLPI